ncbi:MAG: GTP 3',8-cyclase MoaA [Gammaproteobacteria bacterium]|nr:GTP 3',8-cyclase MoaA [Gammaproteobacteria bacterium]MDH5728689.1 GTP 3',8-cyclase MoaA [Gammaproteobacteria bacterium]
MNGNYGQGKGVALPQDADQNGLSTRPDAFAPLQDTFGRTFDYVRIAVTEKCNLRCTYCMPEEGVDFKNGEQILSADEILRTIDVLARMGVKKVRFTGGEPLVRKDIVKLVEGAANTPGIQAVHLTSNGIIFPKYAQALRDAGLTGINISLDTVEEQKFKDITRRPGEDKVLESIELALQLGFPRVKVNTVVMRGFNDDELFKFTEMTKDKALTVRFIEFMPFDAHQIWETGEYFLSAETMIKRLKERYPLIQPASGTRTEHHIFQVPSYKGKIAIIPAFTRSLCGNCSRIRVTADGGVRNCLYSDQEFSVFEQLRDGCSDEDIVSTFRRAFKDKARDGFESKKKSAMRESTVKFQGRVSMTQIGG